MPKNNPPEETQKPNVPETDLSSKVEELRSELAKLEYETRSLDGKIANRNPAAIARLKTENEQLKARVSRLEKALYAVLLEDFRPSENEIVQLQYEVLRQAAIEYFKAANTDLELWKNIVS